MASQSGRSLPVVYQPFDATKRAHWNDRGAIFDFLAAAGDGDILDFGPGDGWPSLPLAPFVRSVTGVDASPRRVAVCQANAARLGLTNFRGVHYRAGEPLPFPDGCFDAVVAASSLEQTPDPVALLRELYRVLKPGGRLRMSYESLEGYRGGQERDLWAWAPDEATTQFLLTDRRPDAERAINYALRFAAPLHEVAAWLGAAGRRLTLQDLTPDALLQFRPLLVEASTYTLFHPRCETWQARLLDAGFQSAVPTHAGRHFAMALFDSMDPPDRPTDLEGVDRLLRPLVRVIANLEAPPHLNPPITAIREDGRPAAGDQQK